jgi:DNA-binding CsgD family transcriptional regulator/tetratricopeptide (TPR) repeat protein
VTAVAATGPSDGFELLERSEALAALSGLLADVVDGGKGRLALVRGEAGAGKTTLVRRFCEGLDGGRVLWGACDPLFTPRPLGPFLDIAAGTGGALAELAGGNPKPYEFAAGLIAELCEGPSTVLVVEDAHWADEATVDVLRIVVRRIAESRVLGVVTLREDELERSHPLRSLLGELSLVGRAVRLDVPALTPAAVALLARPYGLDADALYRRTGGNAFFVTEALASGATGIPESVRDAVLARAARLSPGARELLDAVSIASPQLELVVAEELAPRAVECLGECVIGGMLRAGDGGIAFRHELARMAIEESLPADRRVGLHRKALEALVRAGHGAPDLPRLVHHAEGAADADAILRYAQPAGDLAASVGAYREAAAHYGRALRFAERLEPRSRAELLERRGQVCYLTDQNDEAVAATGEAAECYRALGDPLREGNALRIRAEFLWCPGRIAEANAAAEASVELLERLEPGLELGYAYACRSYLCRGAADGVGGLRWAEQALELADRIDDVGLRIATLASLADAEAMVDPGAGLERLDQAYALAQRQGQVEASGWVPETFGRIHLARRNYQAARRYLDDALVQCNTYGLELYRRYVLAMSARVELDQGRWQEAAVLAEQVLRTRRASTTPTIGALVVTALLHARRGEPGAHALLEEAQQLAQRSGELYRLAPVAAARAETAWLEGHETEIGMLTDDILALAIRRRASWIAAELAVWRRRGGLPDGDEGLRFTTGPCAAELSRGPEAAAGLWQELGCPYESALALAQSGDEASLLRSLVQLQELDAQPAARIVTRRLRQRGVRGLPRGARPSTRSNRAGLTRRELDVLALLAEGLRNREIADRLYVAPKTVDHHVAAILRKLNVENRNQAARIAADTELLEQRT